MSSLICIGVELNKIEHHPDADRLDIVWVNDYQAIVQRDRFKPGDRAIYVGEQAIIPFDLLKAEGFWNEEKDEGLLAGPRHDRVKAVRLRGIFSQGILITPLDSVEVGKDYSEELGITKWEPPIPAHLAGKVYNTGLGGFSYTDIENIKNWPDVLQYDEAVICTEKLHGTCFIIHCAWDNNDQCYKIHVSSKGHAAKGLALQDEPGNFYWRVAHKYGLPAKLVETCQTGQFQEMTLFGEGLAVQDLKYGLAGGDTEARFFDMRVVLTNEANYRTRKYLDHWAFVSWMNEWEIPTVPLLAKVPFDKDIIAELTKGKETLSGHELHVREGIVIRPAKEREDAMLGRVILKSISEDYLLRRNKDATEFE